MSDNIQQKISLKSFNTFGINVAAENFAITASVDMLKEYLHWANATNTQSTLIGGGSNILFTKDVKGLVIKNNIKGIEKIKEDDGHVYLKVGAGEVWHQFVLHCIENDYAGVENLSLIPGCVGASPMQNIGAYGVEIKEVFEELTAVHRFSLEEVKFSNLDCRFGYRESVFKHQYKNQFVITNVTFKLRKTPQYNIAYGAIKQELEKQNVQELSIKAISQAVIAIRSSKLPDPAVVGNAGSFFKNPSIPLDHFLDLKKKFPAIVAYENTDGTMKLAAGWLIEQCGLKGYRNGDAGVHDKQALVLVNFGNASGADVLAVCRLVQQTVLDKFGVELSLEVNIL